MPRALHGLTLASCLAAVVATGSGTAAAGWPTPAGGESASGDPEVLFTFDDGPHERWTPMVLDALADHDVTAIFFWVGHRVEGKRKNTVLRRKLVDRALKEGHLIGNHTVNHKYLCRGKKDKAAYEIDHNQKVYEKLTGMPITLFRAPYGNHCKRLVKMLEERNLRHLYWDIDPREYLGKSPDTVTKYVTTRLRRLKGRAIVLMHDTKSSTARAMPKILTWIKEENQRRASKGLAQIRILSGSDLFVEGESGEFLLWAKRQFQSARKSLSSNLLKLVPGAGALNSNLGQLAPATNKGAP